MPNRRTSAAPFIEKVHVNAAKRLNEIAGLEIVRGSHIESLVPRLLEISSDGTLRLQRLSGRLLRKPTAGIVYQLGSVVKVIHELPCGGGFGPLAPSLDRSVSQHLFSEFVATKLSMWHARLSSETPLIAAYVRWCTSRLNVMASLLNDVRPVFCHGDLNLNNILVCGTHLSGLVDWEDCGTYCLEWELRKLAPWLLNDTTLLPAFLAGYGTVQNIDLVAFRDALHCLAALDLVGHAGWCEMKGHHVAYVRTTNTMEHMLKD